MLLILQATGIVLGVVTAISLVFTLRTLSCNLHLFLAKLRHLPRPPYPTRNPLRTILEGHGLLGQIFHPDPVEAGGYLSRVSGSLKSSVFVLTGPLLQAEVVVYSAEAVRTIVQSCANSFSKPSSFRQFISSFAGTDSIFVLEGAPHRRMRHAIATALRNDNLQRLDRHFVKRAEALARELATESMHLPPVYVIRRATFDMIITACFGDGVVSADDMQQLLSLYHGTLDDNRGYHPLLSLISVTLPFVPPHWVSVLERNKRELRRRVLQLCTDVLRRTHEREAQPCASGGADAATSLLSVMLEACDEGNLTAEELESTVLSFLIAGQATTTIAFAWTVYLLAVNDDWQTRVYNEVRGAWRPSDPLRTLDELPLLHRVVKETLRLHPPLQNTVRRTDCPVVIDGQCVPAGVTVRVPIVALQRMERYWGSDASKFNPDRFLKLDSDPDVRWLWSTFWFGTHSCVGQRFALLEIKAFIAVVLLKFRVVATVGDGDEGDEDGVGNLEQDPDSGSLVYLPRDSSDTCK